MSFWVININNVFFLWPEGFHKINVYRTLAALEELMMMMMMMMLQNGFKIQERNIFIKVKLFGNGKSRLRRILVNGASIYSARSAHDIPWERTKVKWLNWFTSIFLSTIILPYSFSLNRSIVSSILFNVWIIIVNDAIRNLLNQHAREVYTYV